MKAGSFFVFVSFCVWMLSSVLGQPTPAPSVAPANGTCSGSCAQCTDECCCDTDCSYFDDCCEDIATYCATDSCQNRCTETGNGKVTGTCSCDPSCPEYGDCCSDFYTFCPGNVNTTLSCNNGDGTTRCGEPCTQDAACCCSADCLSQQNCCGDFQSQCLNGSCALTYGEICTSEATECYCDTSCLDYSDCCPDYSQLMYANVENTTLPVSQTGLSCMASPVGAGACFPLGSDNCCYCDPSCLTYQDCCSDYLTFRNSSSALLTCLGQCGNSSVSNGRTTCSCASDCSKSGNCCSDFSTTCAQNLELSCSQNCGGQSCSNDTCCYCDSMCQTYGDCCDDQLQQCGELSCSTRCGQICLVGTTPPTSDSGASDSGASLATCCACDADCASRGDCCGDFQMSCVLSTMC